jgi:predicted nucleic acid-binding protein
MIVVDNSVFIDLLFEYNQERTGKADTLFEILEGNEIPIFEPKVFRIELIGQLVRRMNRAVALKVAEDFLARSTSSTIPNYMMLLSR